MKKTFTIDMKLLRKCLFVSGIMMAAGLNTADAALTKDFYASSSVLSSDNWVKVGIEQTGVYEISYEALRAMGFSDPSKVSVYGRGGRVLPESFVSNAGVPVLTDDLAPVKVLHEGDKLYFYGLGPEEISFETKADYSTGGYFERKSNNIYSFRGYYFLTDSRPVTAMTKKSYDSSPSQLVDKGVSYVYHELDLVQNTTMSGQLFWGENIGLPGNTRLKWNIDMPDAIPGDGVMHCELYFPDRGFGPDAKVSYGFEGTQGFFSAPYTKNTSLYYSPHQPAIGKIEVPGNKGDIFVEFIGEDMGAFSNLDFWVVSYERSMPTMKGAAGEKINQQLLAIPSIAKNNTGRVQLENAASLMVLDVTNVTDPQVLSVTQSGPTAYVGVRNSNKTPVIVVFDKEQPQLKISGYESAYRKIENQNLHSYKDSGADFVIITTPSLKPYAEELAELHRQHDGIKVIVATTEECYNEFSGGVPDPMAYRSFARMLYFSSCQPKNILLFGPLYGDFRGILEEHNPMEGIIAYQSPSISISRGAHNINDFYGMMSDKFRTDYYERNEVNIGVGILPIKFNSEAKIIVDKVRNWMERDDHAYYLNRFTGIGGIGDEHTHDIQVRDLDTHIRTMDNLGTLFTPLSIDTYGNREAQKKFFNQLNEGCNMFSYFGHGAEQFIGKNRYFFNAGDVFKLRNKIHPFALFGGCQITNTDRGFRGLGETIVTATEYGCIGSIVSARDTWSGQNFEFFKQFFTCLYTEGASSTSTHRSGPVTIGEVYASVKNYSTYSNELSYQLLCDPALIFPIINQPVTLDNASSFQLKPGETVKLSGKVTDSNGSLDSKFNGQLVVRLNEPQKEIGAGMIESKEDPGSLEFVYRDNQVSMAVGEVKNGQFEVSIHVPSTLSEFAGDKGIIYLCAYDGNTKKGAGQSYLASIGTMSGNTAESGDRIAPVIEDLSFSNMSASLSLTVSDNVALNMSGSPLNKGLYLYIDGKERSEAHFIEPVVETGRAAYSKEILLDGLTYGEHSARLKVKDAAGNSAEKEIMFIYQPYGSRYSITRDLFGATDSTVVRIEGVAPATGSLIVMSAKGEEIWRGSFEGNTITWNHVDFNGNKVEPGHYKAYLIETGNGTQKGHSDPIDIPVI